VLVVVVVGESVLWYLPLFISKISFHLHLAAPAGHQQLTARPHIYKKHSPLAARGTEYKEKLNSF
jgi:hypothetical protein